MVSCGLVAHSARKRKKNQNILARFRVMLLSLDYFVPLIFQNLDKIHTI